MNQKLSLPLPFPDPDLFASTLNAGFAAYPERKTNYDLFKVSEPSIKPDYEPVKMDIENVSRCNFNCPLCLVSEWPKKKRADDMTFDDFKHIIDDQYGLTEIKLQGVGEPLLGEHFADMISYARQKHIWVRSTTNASLLHVNDLYKRVIDADICELQVSVDGATKETYESIRSGGHFEQVTENCQLLNRYGNDRGRRRSRMWVVVQKKNIHELEALVLLAADLGFERLSFSMDVNDWARESFSQIKDEAHAENGMTQSRGEALVQKGRKAGVAVTFWHVFSKFTPGDPEKLCPWPFERAFISSDMRVVPCCLIGDPGQCDLGDGKHFHEVWSSDTYRRFRQDHIDGRIPGICRSCYDMKSTFTLKTGQGRTIETV